MPIDPSTAFVSYSREDLDFVVRLAKDVNEHGARLWVDKVDIRPGQRWEAEIEAAVSSCSRMLVVLSPASIASKNVLAEASLAIDDGKEVIPVLYRDCKVPFRLRPLQYADFRTDYASGFAELLTVLSSGSKAASVDSAQRARAEAEQKQAEDDRAGQEQLDGELRAAEQARQEQLERERQAAEEKTRQEELERQRIAAEKASLEQERLALMAEQARLEEQRKQAAAAKARREQEERERQVAAERARQEEEERRRAAAEKVRAESEAHERREVGQKATPSSEPALAGAAADIPFTSTSPQNAWIKPVGIGLAVLLVIGLIGLVLWQRSREADEREAYARSLAEEHARAERAQQQSITQQPSAATPSSHASESPAPAQQPAQKPQPRTSSSRSLPTTTENESAPPAQASPIDGTWRSSNGNVYTYRSRPGGGLSYTSSQGFSYTAELGGGEVPYEGLPQASVSVVRLSEYVFEETYTKNGRIFAVSRMTVSKDRRTMTYQNSYKETGKIDTLLAQRISP